MTLQQEQQQRSCPRGLTAASRPRFPLQGRPNSLFPCPQDPVPDAPVDYTELWKAVSMTNPPTADKATIKGTEVYGDVLYRFGIDLNTGYNAIANPEEVIDLRQFKSPP